MKKVTYYCDKCGKEIDTLRDYNGIEIGATDSRELDLCKECADKLQAVIEDFFAEVVVR